MAVGNLQGERRDRLGLAMKKSDDISKVLGKWLVDTEGKRWRATCVLRGAPFGRLDGLECNEFTMIPEPWELEK